MINSCPTIPRLAFLISNSSYQKRPKKTSSSTRVLQNFLE